MNKEKYICDLLHDKVFQNSLNEFMERNPNRAMLARVKRIPDIYTTLYFKEKYKCIPQVTEYIDIMADAKVSARDIDIVLDVIAHEEDPIFIATRLEPEIASKIYKRYLRK